VPAPPDRNSATNLILEAGYKSAFWGDLSDARTPIDERFGLSGDIREIDGTPDDNRVSLGHFPNHFFCIILLRA
jgi:hypothetical protein